MYCRKCGNELKDNDKFCGKCGESRVVVNETTTTTSSPTAVKDDNTTSVLYGVISFMAPIIGLIIALATKKDHPKASKVGIIVSIIKLVLSALYIIFWVLVDIAI